MQDYLVAFLSIFISVVLFVVGYRQTIGARKERVRAANSELEKVLLRRIVLESFKPTTEDLSRLINGKARDYRVRSRDLLSEDELLEMVFTRIVESDFVTADSRTEILERLSISFAKAEEITVEKTYLLEPIERRQRIYTRTIIPFMAVITSLIGAITGTLILLPDISKLWTMTTIIAFIASISVIVFIMFTYRFREHQEDTSVEESIHSARDFEKDIINDIVKRGLLVELADPSSGYDFTTKVGEKKIIVEVKYGRRLTMDIIRSAIFRLTHALSTSDAQEAILLTKNPLHVSEELFKDPKIRTMSLREFLNYITHGA